MSRIKFLVALILLFAGCATDDAGTPFRMYSETGVMGHAGGAGPLGQMTGRWRVARNWHADFVGKSGAVLSELSARDQFYLGMGVGPGYSTGEALRGWEFRLSPRVTHIHHASFESWGDTPGSNLAGDSNGGVSHRSGLELNTGINGPQIGTVGPFGVLWSADAMVDYLPNSDDMRYSYGAVLGVSLTGW